MRVSIILTDVSNIDKCVTLKSKCQSLKCEVELVLVPIIARQDLVSVIGTTHLILVLNWTPTREEISSKHFGLHRPPHQSRGQGKYQQTF